MHQQTAAGDEKPVPSVELATDKRIYNTQSSLCLLLIAFALVKRDKEIKKIKMLTYFLYFCSMDISRAASGATKIQFKIYLHLFCKFILT
jgi:hypothetical protein